jgi:hypothetical protein
LWSVIQFRIGAAFAHRNVSLMRTTTHKEPNGPVRYTVPEEDLAGLFVMLNVLRPLGLADVRTRI